MAEDDDEDYDHISSMVVIRESPIFAKEDSVVFPPVNHENLQVASSIYGMDRYLESLSESESSSSSPRCSGSFSSFSLFPSDSDGQQSPLTACQFDRKSPQTPTEQGGESPPCDSVEKSPREPLYSKVDVFRDWWEFLLVNVYSKLKNLVTWFSTTLRSFYPILAIAIWWWWTRVRARRKHVKVETTNGLRDTIKERYEKMLELLNQIAQMNELLVKHHKNIVSRR